MTLLASVTVIIKNTLALFGAFVLFIILLLRSIDL